MVAPWVWALGGVAAIVALVALYHFNRMVQLRNRCSEAWANVDTELARRHDLVPNLVRVVEGYAQHERDVMQRVTEARAAAEAGHASTRELARDERELGDALGRLLARVEDYPELKANRSFLELQEELAITEDRIQAARRFYNGNVRDYRNLVRGFPGMIFARVFGFGGIEFFDVEPVKRPVPAVEG